MFELTQAQLKTLYGDGGEPFRRFANDLLRAEAFTCGIPLDQLDLQVRANVGDGGVDASVATAISNSKSGWFDAPTCWQYKAAAYRSTEALIREVESEMEKEFAARRIAEGYAYRFCMLESIPEKSVVSQIQTAMQNKADAICKATGQSPQTPRLVHNGDLSSWADMYPAVGIRVQGLSGDFQLFSPWLRNQRDVTATYVKNPAWSSIADQIVAHVDFSMPPIGNDICYSIAGNSGVGKTRLVSESLGLIDAADALVIQTDVGDEALRIASYLSQERHRHAILVVDECSPQTLFDLRQRLRSFANSLRVVAIEHLDRIPIRPPEDLGSWLSEPGTQTTLEILNQNFPSVSPERRQIYSRISEGFIRFAADLCDHDAEIDIDAMTGSLDSIYAYLERRLGSDQDVVGSLALFSKIGYRDDVSGELVMLSDLTGISVDDVFPMFRELQFSSDLAVTQKAIQTLSGLAANHSPEVMETFGNALLDKRGIYLRAQVCNDLVAAIDHEVIVSWLERKGERTAEVFARHLPQPFLNENGEFIVPELLDRVLERFGTDAVLSAFHAGLNSSGTYWGDLSPILHERAERYKTLLDHKNPAIRRLAREEVAFLSDWAKREKLREEEDAIVT